MKKNLTRREALASLGLVAGTLLAACGADAAAPKPAAAPSNGAANPPPGATGPLPHVLATDPLAVALAYHESAKAVEVAKFLGRPLLGEVHRALPHHRAHSNSLCRRNPVRSCSCRAPARPHRLGDRLAASDLPRAHAQRR